MLETITSFFKKVLTILTLVWALVRIVLPLVFALRRGYDGNSSKPTTSKESIMLSYTQKEMIEALKNMREWQLFLEEVEAVVIAEIKEHKGEAWWKVLLEIVMNAATKCSEDGINAIKDSGLIPQEFKDATAADWVTFAVTVLINQGKILSALWTDKPAV